MMFKVDGKVMPKVNLSLLQVHTRKRKSVSHSESDTKCQRNSDWKSSSTQGTKEDFAQSFHDEEYDKMLSRFNEVAFGMVCRYKNQLIMGKLVEINEYDAGALPCFIHGVDAPPPNF